MRQVKKDSVNVSVELYILDSTDGTPETGVLWNTAGIDLNYRRDGAVVTSITEATLAALTTAHTDGGFLEVGDGRYRFDVPDAAFATGVSQVTIGGTVTGMVVVPNQVQLVDFDPDDATRMGLTSLPNAAADAAGGLAISDAGGLDLDALSTVTTANLATALTDIGLDHLVSASVTGTDITDNSIVAQLVSSSATADWDDYDNTARSLMAIGALAFNISTDTNTTIPQLFIDYNLDHLFTQAITGPDVANNSFAALLVSASATAVWTDYVNTTDSLQAIRDNQSAGGGDATAANQTTILTRLGTPSDLGGGADLSTNNSDMAGATFSTTTDSNEAIRNRGDSSWVTGAGGTGLTPLAEGTAQSGTASTITLSASPVFADNILNGSTVNLLTGTGAAQSRKINSNTGQVCTVQGDWVTDPDGTSTYEVVNGTRGTVDANIVSSTITATQINNSVDASSIEHTRGDYFSANLLIGNITGQTKVLFSIKTGDLEDSEANIHMDSVTGLIYSNGTTATAASGSITVNNETTGDIDIVILDEEMVKMPIKNDLIFDTAWIDANGHKRTKTKGTFDNQWGVTKETT